MKVTCRAARAAVILLALVLMNFAKAETPPPSLADYHHTAWTRKQGAPGLITALAQTADGWLWIGSPGGLYRFDGVRFERYEPFAGGVLSLLATPDGALWIGRMLGGASRLQDGRLVHYGPGQGLSSGASVTSLARDTGGTLWAATGTGLYRFDGGRWVTVPLGDDRRGGRVVDVVAAADGSVWVRGGRGLWAGRRGDPSFRRVGDVDPAGTWLAAHPGGSVWVARATRPLTRLDGPQPATGALPLVEDIHFDRDGRLWGSRDEQGLVLMPPGADGAYRAPEPSAAMGRAQGASGMSAVSFLEDREGTVWIGTEGGLDRFRRTRLIPLRLANSQRPAIAAADDGGLYVGRPNLPSVHVQGTAFRDVPDGPDLGLNLRACAHRDLGGVVWLCGKTGFLRIQGGQRESIPLPPDLAADDSMYVQGLSTDLAGGLWLLARGGVQRWSGGRWVAVTGEPFASQGLPHSVASDGAGRVWFGFSGNRVYVLEGGTYRRIDETQGLQVGDDVKVIVPRGDHVWIGGSDGVALCVALRCRTVAAANGSLRGVSGIIETASHGLWLNGTEGIAHVSAAELQSVLKHGLSTVHPEWFDADDGLEGMPAQVRPMPTAVEGTDGRLWFVTTGGVYSIAPAHIPRNTLPPPVKVLAVHAGGTNWTDLSAVHLPKHTTAVSVSFTALSLKIPERVRFRYRLDGVDDHWQDGGSRRQVFYTNLRPGHYRFRVIAANDDGVWNPEGASVEFDIAPAFYQTTLFRLALGLAGVLAVALLFRWRLWRARQVLRGQMLARQAERERIARELHDTLLQGLTAVVLRFHAFLLKERMSPELRASMEDVLDRADQIIEEGRDRVLELRVADNPLGLAAALDECARHLVADSSTQWTVDTVGAHREVHDAVRHELFQIGKEAMANAFRHAQAGRIDVTLDYGPQRLLLRVRDDGRGLPAELAQAGGRPGHWGLSNMRERAERLGGQWRMVSNAEGTCVEVTVLASVAYRPARRAWAVGRWPGFRRGRPNTIEATRQDWKG